MSLVNFTPEDLQLLREMIASEKARRQNREIRDDAGGLPSKPEVYIAYPQTSVTAATLATGTSSDADVPGYGVCDIYKIIGEGANAEIQRAGFDKIVYNLTETEITDGPISVKRDKFGKWMADTGGGCAARDEVIQLTVLGSPTGGTFDLTINTTGVGTANEDTVTINWDDTSAEVATALATHSDITSSDVSVSGGPLPDATITIQFTGDLAETDIPIPNADWSSLTGGTGVGVIISVDQQGYPN